MPSPWVLLLLAVLGGACALPAPEPLSYTEALAQAVDSYNGQPEVRNAFRLLSAEPEPGPVSAPPPRVTPPPRSWCLIGAAQPDPEPAPVSAPTRDPPFVTRTPIPVPSLVVPHSGCTPVLIQRGRFGRFLRKVRRFRPKVKFNVHLKGSVGLG
ncbi:CTHL2 protein, partial [Calcarius ornatus]|nr:CTHL2 protein [Calcarius ornatus]